MTLKRKHNHINRNQKIKKLAVGTSEGYILVDFDSILYLQSDNNYTTFYLTNNSKFIATKNLGYYEKKLLNEQFIRIHHSTIVNLVKITKYVKADGGRVIISTNKSLQVSRNRKANLIRLLKELC